MRLTPIALASASALLFLGAENKGCFTKTHKVKIRVSAVSESSRHADGHHFPGTEHQQNLEMLMRDYGGACCENEETKGDNVTADKVRNEIEDMYQSGVLQSTVLPNGNPQPKCPSTEQRQQAMIEIAREDFASVDKAQDELGIYEGSSTKCDIGNIFFTDLVAKVGADFVNPDAARTGGIMAIDSAILQFENDGVIKSLTLKDAGIISGETPDPSINNFVEIVANDGQIDPATGVASAIIQDKARQHLDILQTAINHQVNGEYSAFARELRDMIIKKHAYQRPNIFMSMSGRCFGDFRIEYAMTLATEVVCSSSFVTTP